MSGVLAGMFLFLQGSMILIVMGGIIYLYFLVVKYLKKSIEKNEETKILVLNNSKPQYIKNQSNSFLININLAKSLYIKDHSVYVDLINEEIYLLYECENEEEAESKIEEIHLSLNNDNR